MDDYISRNGTVEALCAMECGDDSEHCVKRTCEIFTTLMRLPAAPVREAKRGRWIDNKNGTWSCSRCQSWIPDEQHHYARYCVYCGADMRMEMRGGPNNVKRH